jgi:hypothetical protein
MEGPSDNFALREHPQLEEEAPAGGKSAAPMRQAPRQTDGTRLAPPRQQTCLMRRGTAGTGHAPESRSPTRSTTMWRRQYLPASLRTHCGIVALNIIVCRASGTPSRMRSTSCWNPMFNISSASSKMKNLIEASDATLRQQRCGSDERRGSQQDPGNASFVDLMWGRTKKRRREGGWVIAGVVDVEGARGGSQHRRAGRAHGATHVRIGNRQ